MLSFSFKAVGNLTSPPLSPLWYKCLERDALSHRFSKFFRNALTISTDFSFSAGALVCGAVRRREAFVPRFIFQKSYVNTVIPGFLVNFEVDSPFIGEEVSESAESIVR
jgi:hypothetical protein